MSVPFRPPARLIPHDRSSVRRPQRRRSLGPERDLVRVALRRRIPLVLLAVALALPSALRAQESYAQPTLQLPRGARLFLDTLALRPLPMFGPFGSATRLRRNPARVADAVIGAAERTRDGLLSRRWAIVVQAGMQPDQPPTALPTLDPALVAVAAATPDSGLRPGSLVPLAPTKRSDAKKTGTDVLADFGGLGIRLDSRLETKLQRSKNERCTAAQSTLLGSNCFGSFAPPDFNFQFNVRTGGVVADRVNVNVDFDSQREFDASNNISVFYQGKTDEVLQRLEVGNVTFQPPPSRFLTTGIPSGNYGIQARGQLGPMRFTTIIAQQKGNISKDNLFTVGERTQQQVERPIDDIQVETRRFFFTVDPRRFAPFPNVDLLNRQQMQQLAAALPDSVRPTRIFLYRQTVGAANQNPRGPQFSVRGARNGSRQVYEVLRENVDYYVDPSQLWIALVRPLNSNNERLAVAYEINSGGVAGRNINTGGTPDVEFTDAPQFANLLWEPELQPTTPDYFFREIKSVYRLGGEDVQRSTVSVKLVTGTSGDQEKPFDPSRGETYLQLFGLAQATNSATFDVENRVWPRPNDPNFSAASGGQQKLFRDYFIFYPSAQPFARAGLAQPLANPANDTLYRYPNEYLYSAQRPQAIYRMIARYQSDGGANAGAIQLRSTQLRPKSESVALEGRLLVRDVDYTIDYDLGSIAFTRPDTLFPRPRQVSVRYEENPLFAAAPTSIFGVSTQFPLSNGQISFTAISQSQKSGQTRPTLGFEPIGSLVAGVTADMSWDATALTRALSKLPFDEGATRSRISMQGEFAMSKPQPNSAGQAYIESFEGNSGRDISLSDASWYFSSRPSLGSKVGAQIGSNTLSLNRATTLAYQNNGVDTAGTFVQYSIQQIDPAVKLVGGGVQPRETLLWLNLYPLKTGGIFDFEPTTGKRRFAWTVGDNSMVGNTPTGRRWRSLRHVFNPSGEDLSRIENIEFYVQVQTGPTRTRKNPTLMFDFGEISENSVAFAPETLTVNPSAKVGLPPDSTYRGKRLVGFDRFDSERDPFSRAFNAAENDKGLPGDIADTIVVVDKTKGTTSTTTQTKVTLCSSSVQITQVLGDSRANCGVRNNRLDEEDIDLDGRLNLTDSQTDQESFKRFTVDLSDRKNWTRVGRCDVDTTTSGGAFSADSVCWVQIRLNWRAPLEEQNSPNDRRTRALRMTMVSSVNASDDEFTRVALARFRLVGAPWLKRADRPISGLAGDSIGVINGYVIASSIGTLDSTTALPYTPPPGVVEAPDTRQTGYENTTVQVNEHALRLRAGVLGGVLRPFDRAEAFYRFPEGTKSFMGYKSLRVWMRGNGHGWGSSGELNGFIKLGRDENNFYMYRTTVDAGLTQAAWNPEVRVDLTRFQFLRSQLESNFLTASKDSLACTGADLAMIKRSGLPRGVTVRRYAVCQDGYIVYSADPSVSPPNLAGVQELAVGFVRVDSIPRGGNAILPNDSLELWIDDIRLTDVVDDIGFAGELGLSMNAGDLADLRVNVSRRDPNFRQLGETPTFLTTSGVSVGTTMHLERMLPARLGIVLPFSVDYSGTGVDQLFINRTDVRASGINGLRNPGDKRVSYSMALRRAAPLTHGWYAPVLNGLTLNGAWSNASSQSAFQTAKNSNYVVGANFALASEERDQSLPWFINRIVGILPRSLKESESIRSFRTQKFRWAPTQFRLSSTMARNTNSLTSFTKAAASPTDTGQVTLGLSHFWSNNARVDFQPTSGLTASVEARQLLDLRDYRDASASPDSADRRQAAAAERMKVLGKEIGLERERSLTSAIAFAPQFSQWLRPSIDFTSRFDLTKDPNARALLRDGDSTGAFRLPKRLGASQTIRSTATFDFARLLTSVSPTPSLASRFGQYLAPITLNWTQSLNSNYDNTVFMPGPGYQFGLGSLTEFRGLKSRLATSAGRVRQFTAVGSLSLPLGLNFGSRFEEGTSETWTRRSVDGFQALITSAQHVRPDYNLRWIWRPKWFPKVLTLVSVNGRYLVTEQETTIPNDAGGIADRSQTLARSRPISGSITWAFLGGITTNGAFDRTHREDTRPGSLTTGDTKRLSFDVARQFTLPKRWNTRGKLRTQLSYQSEETQSVVGGSVGSITDGTTTTTAIGSNSVLTNNGLQRFNLNAVTDVSELVTFSLTASQSLTFDKTYNRRVSNTTLSATLQLRFYAGELR